MKEEVEVETMVRVPSWKVSCRVPAPVAGGVLEGLMRRVEGCFGGQVPVE